MIDVYLFDWGGTLMVDLPEVHGKMCDWKVVEAVDGAFEVLEYLSKRALVYIATGAAESGEADILKAFERVDLSQFITGYFCKTNLGIAKGDPDFLPQIVNKLGKPVSSIAMVGDSFIKDIEPALAIGIKPIWLSKNNEVSVDSNVQVIRSLRELCV